jgi:hypothetical protein
MTRWTSVLFAVAYLLAMLVAVLRADRGMSLYAPPTLVLLSMLHLATGALIARWWVLLLPIMAIAMAAGFAEPDSPSGAETPIWIGMVFWSPGAIALTLAGVLAGRIARSAGSRVGAPRK